MREMSSNILEDGGNTLSRYNEVAKSVIVDFDLRDLPASIKEEDLKKVSGAKHVISATIDQDSIRNVCTGTGRIQLRLTEKDDIDQVKLSFLKAGFGVQDHSENSKKKPFFTQE